MIIYISTSREQIYMAEQCAQVRFHTPFLSVLVAVTQRSSREVVVAVYCLKSQDISIYNTIISYNIIIYRSGSCTR